MDKLFNHVAYKISRLVTREYSTSFSKAVSLLEKQGWQAIYSIYGFVRYADEMVDTYPGLDKKEILIAEIRNDFDASYKGILLLPGRSKLAVATACYYYRSLLGEIRRSSAENVRTLRVRISGLKKFLLFLKAYTAYSLKLI